MLSWILKVFINLTIYYKKRDISLIVLHLLKGLNCPRIVPPRMICLIFYLTTNKIYSSLKEGSCLIYYICVCLRIVVSNTYCCYVFLRLAYLMLPVSLECLLLIASSVLSLSLTHSLSLSSWCEA